MSTEALNAIDKMIYQIEQQRYKQHKYDKDSRYTRGYTDACTDCLIVMLKELKLLKMSIKCPSNTHQMDIKNDKQ